MKLKINKTTVELSFGMLMFRNLGKRWKLNSVNEVIGKLSVFDEIKDDIPFNVFDTLFDLIEVSAQIKNSEIKLDYNEVCEVMMTNPELLQEVMNGIVESLPKPKQEVNPENRKKK